MFLYFCFTFQLYAMFVHHELFTNKLFAGLNQTFTTVNERYEDFKSPFVTQSEITPSNDTL